ncbi:lipoprotein OmlA [Neokomagataea thailandica NBRC 106555]|nr:lipoprotein OmlA [Neokomagataea thailandica NBRC 106555]
MGGCSLFSPIPQPRGSLIEKADYSQLIPGTSTQSDAMDLLGSPTAHATFDDNTWIYVSMITSPRPLSFPKIDKQQVVVLNFDNSGVLRKLNTLGKSNAVNVGMVGRTTPAPGTKTSVIQQLLGNVGRYNPMSNMGSTFGGSSGPMSNQGTGNGGSGNTLP